jgi:hypothetical protein
LVTGAIDVAVKFPCIDAGETPAEMADAPVSWLDKNLSGERHCAHFVWCVYVTSGERSQPFRENKRARICWRDYELAVRIDGPPQSVVPDGSYAVSEWISMLECWRDDDISNAVDVTSLVAFSAPAFLHKDWE